MTKTIAAPSLLAADPLAMRDEVRSLEKGGADWLHFDVMDGHFVPNLTLGIPLLEAMKKDTKLLIDVHIMVSNPDAVAADYVKAGADVLTFHWEAANHPHRIIQEIHSLGGKAGIALNPGTPVESCFALLDSIDLVLLMSVNPGFGGQKFISGVVPKIQTLAAELDRIGRRNDVTIEVDGGVNGDNAPSLVDAGATALVAGSYVFKAKDRAQAIKSLQLDT